ncbi:MAG: hypothetical protein QCI82_09950 [Candidatus Thermoplasmatota archaeon]|nr:hypothetical protein [Candidatus Thermoplasmatota archaeon]
MNGRIPKRYRSGDQIHIAVTQNFEDVATDFFQFCKDNHYNPSEVIRSCMENWLVKQKRLKEVMEGGVERDERSSVEKERRIIERLREEGFISG